MVTTAEMLGTGYGGSGGLGAGMSPEVQSMIYGPYGQYGNPYGLNGAYGGYQQGMPMTNLLVPSTLEQPAQQPMMQIPFDNYYGVNPNGPPSGFIQNTSPQSNQTTSQTGQGGGQSQTPGPSPGGAGTQAGGGGSSPTGPGTGTPMQTFSSLPGPNGSTITPTADQQKWLQVNAHPAGSWTAGMSYGGSPITADQAAQLNRVAAEPNNPTWFNANSMTNAMQQNLGVPKMGGGYTTPTSPTSSITPTAPRAPTPTAPTPLAPTAPVSGRGSFYATQVPRPR